MMCPQLGNCKMLTSRVLTSYLRDCCCGCLVIIDMWHIPVYDYDDDDDAFNSCIIIRRMKVFFVRCRDVVVDWQ